jgi:C4-dicarboxylate transporter, DctM subunit
MSTALLVSLGSAVMVLLLLGGMWIPFAIGVGGILMLVLYEGPSALNALGFIAWGSLNSTTLSAVPLFILMAEILLRSGVSSRFYDGLSKFSWALPGGLIQTNILGCALFSAICGSSVATAAAIGGVSLPRAREENYDTAMSCGSIAAGGTLGILIPPSIPLIIYASFAEVSIVQLFAASMLPGVLLTIMFMLYVAARAIRNPSLVPKGARPTAVGAYVLGLVEVLPLFLLVGCVLGTIYMGIATPTEAAAVGVFAATVIAVILGRPPLGVYYAATVTAVKVSASLLFITLSAYFFAYAVESTGLGVTLTQWVVGMELNRYVFLAILIIMYAVMGCVIDSIGMIVLTVPILIPILIEMQFDLLWFGVILIVVVELGLITPPMGINLFVVQSIAKVGIGTVIRGIYPYYFVIALFVALLIAFPEIALWPVAFLR